MIIDILQLIDLLLPLILITSQFSRLMYLKAIVTQIDTFCKTNCLTGNIDSQQCSMI